jgi:hypothetical protein
MNATTTIPENAKSSKFLLRTFNGAAVPVEVLGRVGRVALVIGRSGAPARVMLDDVYNYDLGFPRQVSEALRVDDSRAVEKAWTTLGHPSELPESKG